MTVRSGSGNTSFVSWMSLVCAIASAVAAICSYQAADKANQITVESNNYEKSQRRKEFEASVRPVLRFNNEYVVVETDESDFGSDSVPVKPTEDTSLTIRNLGKGAALNCALAWSIYESETNKKMAIGLESKLSIENLNTNDEVTLVDLPRHLFVFQRTKGTLEVTFEDTSGKKHSLKYEFTAYWEEHEKHYTLRLRLSPQVDFIDWAIMG